MLTDLRFLSIGQSFPPTDETDRLEKYNKNRLIFEGKHEQVYKDSFDRIARVIGNFDKVVSYSVIANYQKLISLKIADFLLGEPPKILCGEDNSTQQNSIEKIKENSDLVNTLYTSAIDISRYGDSVLNVYKDNDKGVIDITQPSFYFKIVDAKNIKKTLYHVLAHTYSITGTESSFFGAIKEEKTTKYLYVQVHSKGFYEESTLILNKQGIIESVSEDVKKISTGLDDFAIVPIHNLLTSDRVYGIDDYTDLDSIVSEIEVRISQISKILDKHAEPSMQGPETALQLNPVTNQWELKTGNYFPKSPDDSDVSYITWDAQLTANFEVIDKLINVLSVVSEMGSAIFDNEQKQGIASGTALRRMMISPLAKTNRIRMRFDSSIKKAIKLCSQLGGEGITNLSKESINIFWNDGLPSDELEEANIMAIRTGNKPTISQYSAIQRQDSLNDEDTQKELDAISEDTKRENPLQNMNFDYAKENNSSSFSNGTE